LLFSKAMGKILKLRHMVFFIPLILLWQNCGGFEVNNSSQLNGEVAGPQGSISPAQFSCEDEDARGLSDYRMRRLTRAELEQTLKDIFGEEAVAQVSSQLGLYIHERFAVNQINFDTSLDSNGVRALYGVAEAISTLVTSDMNYASRYAPSCMLGSSGFDLSSETCLQGFVNDIGLKIYRRPLTEQKANEYFQLLRNGNNLLSSPAQRVRAVLMQALLSVQFAFHLPGDANTEANVSTNLLRNPGFEDGLANWSVYGNTTSISSGQRSGSQALRIGAGGGGAEQDVMSSLIVGNSYTLSAYIRQGSSSEQGHIGIKFLDSANNNIGEFAHLGTSTSYAQGSVSFNVPQGATRALVFAWKPAGNAPTDYDDFTLTDNSGSQLMTSNSSGKRERVDQYTLASRLSYRVSGSMPDAELFAAAGRGELTNAQSLRTHAERLIQSRQGRAFVREIFSKWLLVNGAVAPSQTYGEHIGVEVNGLTTELEQEALDFVEHVVFEMRGNFHQLMTAEIAFPPSANTAKIFGLSQASNGVNDPLAVTDNRAGLLMRPLLFISSTNSTAPIHRGYIFNKQFLCQDIPQPSGADIAVGDSIGAQLDSTTMTTREFFQHVTSPTSCNSCHQFINPPGFLFEQFGPFGEVRQMESIFDNQGQLIRQLPINTQVDGILIDAKRNSIADAKEAAQTLAQSAQGQACFATQLFRFSRFVREGRDDGCHLADVEKVIRAKRPVIEAFIENAITEDILWVKTTE
jgi:hypothetical protein